MKFIFYIDESGNTGDISFQENGKGIQEQPFFALAGIGFPENENNHLDLLFTELKKKHRVQAKDLKATNVGSDSIVVVAATASPNGFVGYHYPIKKRSL